MLRRQRRCHQEHAIVVGDNPHLLNMLDLCMSYIKNMIYLGRYNTDVYWNHSNQTIKLCSAFTLIEQYWVLCISFFRMLYCKQSGGDCDRTLLS